MRITNKNPLRLMQLWYMQTRVACEAVRAEKEAEQKFEKKGYMQLMTDRSVKVNEREKWKAEKKIKLKELDLREKELEKEKTGQFQYRRIL